MVENLIQTKVGITINIDASVKVYKSFMWKRLYLESYYM